MEWVRLGDIVKIIKGKKVEESTNKSEKSFRYIQIEDLRNDDNIKYTEDPKATIVNKGHVLIAWDGANAGTVGFNLEGAIGSTISALEINELYKNEFSSEFLGYYLKSKNYYLRATSTGATIPHINRIALLKLKIPKINKVNQLAIVGTFKKIEKIINNRKEQIKAYDDLIESLFFDMLQSELMSDKIEYSKLGDLTSHISSGSTPRGGSSVYKSEGIPLIRSQDVKMNNLDYSNIVYIDTEIHDKMKRSKLKNRDVLLNITGASIGRTAVFYGEDDSANTNQHVAAIRLKDEKVSPEFLSFYFSTEYFQAIIKNISSGGTREALNYKQIREFDIPLISKIKQEKFIKNKEKIEEEKKKLEDSLAELENLFDALMQDAFSGNLFKD